MVCLFRKKYVKSCQIRHTYGEDEEDTLLEDEAIVLAENAVQEGLGGGPAIQAEQIDAPQSAVVTIGGKKCKWCGSTTHSRRSHKDYPHNKNSTH